MEVDDAGSVAALVAPTRKPHELLDDVRTAMEEVAARMLFVKKEGRPKSELRELITKMSLLLITLRGVNRSILVEEDAVKAETERAKLPVDSTTLQLHNLMYEKNHYLKAIKACTDFKSKYPDIDLVPEEEFFRDAPEEIKEKVLAKDGAHDLMLKRLSFELHQRKELCKLHEKLEQHKASLVETIMSKKKFLSSLPSHLKSLKKASLPVQQQLGILHTKKIKQNNSAELLPSPLYIVYSQLLAQKEAFGERIEIEIVGSIKDARTFALQQIHKENGESSNADENKLEDDAADEDDDARRRRKRPRKSLVNDQSGLQLHPLKIILHIYDNVCSEEKLLRLVTLKFEYLLKLNVVCAGVEDTEGSDTNILCNLFPDDTGSELPHQMAKLYSGDSLYFGERTSRPYKWTQHLAGIDFLPELPPHRSCSEILNEVPKPSQITSGLALYRRQNRVQTILQKIRSRKKSQMALLEQLDSLMKLRCPSLVYDNVPWGLHTPSCTLQSWLPVGFIPESSTLSTGIVGQSALPLQRDFERRSVTSWEVENAREDGELPNAQPVAKLPDESAATSTGLSEQVDHSKSLAMISKNVTPSKAPTKGLRKSEDDLDLLLESESEIEEQIILDQETENVSHVTREMWKDFAAREFDLVLSKTSGSNTTMRLNAKVVISMEYPVRPPLFTLSISGGPAHCSEWYNVLRAIEAEVNLHILKIVPLDYENYILSHQIRCLSMLFDFHFGEGHDKTKATSVMDVGLCKPVNGTIIGRSMRGRDRRKMIAWKGANCSLGYPS